MTHIAANLSMLFTERPLLQRVGAAAAAGFKAVELQFPYDVPAQALRQQLDLHQLPMVLHNLPGGNVAAGDRGLACDPARVAEFRDGVAQALSYAKALGVPRLNCLAGIAPAGVADAELHATLVANLRHAAKALADAGLVLLTEPINRRDVPGFWLHRNDQALAVIEEVAAPNLQIQYDIYHAQRSEGELAGSLERYLKHIGHVQFADNPGRHEPGSGEINLMFLMRHLVHIGYRGDVGAEYKPAGRTEDGLAWLPPLQALFDNSNA